MKSQINEQSEMPCSPPALKRSAPQTEKTDLIENKNDPWAPLRAMIAPVMDKLPKSVTAEDMIAFRHALFEEAIKRGLDFLSGIKAYHKHEAERDGVAATIVWEQGTTKLRCYAKNAADLKAPALFVIPSLVNRLDIMDLDPAHSFLRTVAESGFRVFAVDWDEPGEEERLFSLTDYTEKRLFPMMDCVKKQNGDAPILLLGYCMGGVMALGLAALRPQDIQAMTLLAAPWDFDLESQMGHAFSTFIEKLEPVLSSYQMVPSALLQSMFIAHQPIEVLKKYVRFSTQDPLSEAAKRFVLTEDWLNNGVPLVEKVARDCFCAWYGRNETGRDVWQLAGKTIRPRDIKIPSYIVIPQKDRVVRPESAQALADQIEKATIMKPDFGHIGLMASPKAPQEIWKPLIAWLHQQSERSA